MNSKRQRVHDSTKIDRQETVPQWYRETMTFNINTLAGCIHSQSFSFCRRRAREISNPKATPQDGSTGVGAETIHGADAINDEEPHYYSQISEEAMIARSSNQPTQETNPVTDSKDAHLQEANGRATRETQGSNEEDILNGPVEDKNDDGYLAPVNTGQASKADDPSQASKLAESGQALNGGDPVESSNPVPQAVDVYNYAYAHFAEEGRNRDPTAKKAKREPGYIGYFSK